MLVSVVIRTFNEERHLDELLSAVSKQISSQFDIETVIIDSGSTDSTLSIAKKYGARITHIKKEEFTFGRSLNMGCDFANGDYLVFISGHCIPIENDWLDQLCQPLIDGISDYSYGRQIGRDTTKYSEEQIFNKYFPEQNKTPQVGFFCNNANSAVTRKSWLKFKFDEKLTGLEDMYLAKQIVESGGTVSYKADAPVYHIHDETWHRIKIRYEREAIALHKIMPEVQFHFYDYVYCVLRSIFSDLKRAFKEQKLKQHFRSIIMFRNMQYWGAYTGHREYRKHTTLIKQKYFYPSIR